MASKTSTNPQLKNSTPQSMEALAWATGSSVELLTILARVTDPDDITTFNAEAFDRVVTPKAAPSKYVRQIRSAKIKE